LDRAPGQEGSGARGGGERERRGAHLAGDGEGGGDAPPPRERQDERESVRSVRGVVFAETPFKARVFASEWLVAWR
jgi:hypothetical protein